VQVLALSVDRALKVLSRSGQRFDLVFMDPPYGLGLVPRTLLALVRSGLLTDGGCIVAEHEARLHPANEYGPFLRTDLRRYGEIAFSIYAPITNVEGP
jgi:16S rRNA G966 N2-methylase RsmD